jgi:cytochrome c oxidase accessory protein FixG
MKQETPSGGQVPLDGLAAEAAALVESRSEPPGQKPKDEPARPVNAKSQRSLYASRQKIYPKRVNGKFRRAKWIVMILTLSIYYLTPWIRWERAGAIPDQAVLIDFQAQRFYFFFIEIWPQEFYYITGLLILAALGLFLVTSAAGRVWCGYSCPQTVWTDLFIYIERFIEGDRNQRIRLDRQKWTASKLGKKVLKHSIWLIIGAATGGAWIFYFADAPTLLRELPTGEAPFTAYFSMAFFTISTYVMGGLAREQVCTYMCPWPRIQGAMFDEESFLVSYRGYRGEPRSPHKKGATWEGRGDCVDCNQCVVACPMGIDIRDGIQLECIQCALCIDACNTIMKKVGRPTGLIAYETQTNLDHRARGEAPQVKLLRPRTMLYAATMLLVAGIMFGSLLTRSNMELNIVRDRSPVFVLLSDGSIRNGYTLRVMNKEHETRMFEVHIVGPEGARIFQSGSSAPDSKNTIVVGPDSQQAAKFFVAVPKSSAPPASTNLQFVLTDVQSKQTITKSNIFRGPGK